MLTALAIAGVLVVLFLAAALATRESEGLAPVHRDAADVVLPAGPVRADDVRGVRFGLALRGYRMSEVDAVLDRFAGELEDRDRRLRELEGPGAAQEGVEPLPAAAPSEQARTAPPREPLVEPVTAPDTHPVVLAASPPEPASAHPVVAVAAQAPVASQVVLGTTPTAQRTDTPRTDTQRTDTPRTDTLRTDTSGTDTPRTDTPGTDTPRTDVPQPAVGGDSDDPPAGSRS